MKEILRRIAERGLRQAQDDPWQGYQYVDIFQHLLDEIERIEE